MLTFAESDASWIWTQDAVFEINQYVEFRHEFMLNDIEAADAKLFISADSDYAVWLNGCFVDCGQWHNYPEQKTYDILQVGNHLKMGKNVLCILAYYQGETSFQYLKGEPGLIFLLQYGELNIISGVDTICRKSPAYKSGIAPKLTMQLGFTFEYDARKDDGWKFCEYIADDIWETAAKKSFVGSDNQRGLYERPIKKLIIKDRAVSIIKCQGTFIRKKSQYKSIAELMQTDFISARLEKEVFREGLNYSFSSDAGVKIKPVLQENADGIYLVIDLGKEESGIFEIDIDAQNGTIVDVAYGEHLDDLRVRAEVGSRNFASRYICIEGRQRFVHFFKRFAGRYIQMHISSFDKEAVLFFAGIRPCEYPVEIKGEFMCNDHLHKKIYETAVRTLHLCMHEHYEDCPWREQALYSMDSRNQALCGYYCFGEYDFPEASFKLLGDGLKEDGYIELCAPTEFYMTIPSFSMAWIIELWEFLLYSGRVDVVKSFMPKVKKMINFYLGNLSENLLVTPSGERYWNFYEWSQGLDGSNENVHKSDCGVGQLRFDAPLNLFLCLALDAASQLANACGDTETKNEYIFKSECIKMAIHNMFWCHDVQLYKTYSCKCINHYSELVQSLAICAGVCNESIASALREKLACKDNRMVKTTLSNCLYKYEALLKEPAKYAVTVFNEIAAVWGYMLFNKATAFWETIRGADDFEKAGSLCHGWSAIPVYFYYAYILGVKPVQPGFKAFKVEPAYSVFDRASGKIPTPYGDLYVNWEKTGEDVKCNFVLNEEITHGI